MIVFRIAGWSDHFETEKSKGYVTPVKALSPNRMDGGGFLAIMSEPDGLAIYGAFKLMVNVVSKQPKPRNGWLTKDGTATGIPYTAKTLALIFRRPQAEVQRALEVLSSTDIKWLEAHDPVKTLSGSQQSPDGVPCLLSLALPSLALVSLATDSSEVRSTDSKPSVAPPVATEPRNQNRPEQQVSVVLTFPCVGGKTGATEWHLSEDQLAEYAQAFPDLPVRLECQRALTWVNSSPRNRKTATGYAKFLFSWLSRTQDRGGQTSGNRSQNAGGGGRSPELLRPEDVPV